MRSTESLLTSVRIFFSFTVPCYNNKLFGETIVPQLPRLSMTTRRSRDFADPTDRPAFKTAKLDLCASPTNNNKPQQQQLDMRQIPLASGSVIVADVSEYFASYSPQSRTTEPRNSLAKEFFEYLQNSD